MRRIIASLAIVGALVLGTVAPATAATVPWNDPGICTPRDGTPAQIVATVNFASVIPGGLVISLSALRYTGTTASWQALGYVGQVNWVATYRDCGWPARR